MAFEVADENVIVCGEVADAVVELRGSIYDRTGVVGEPGEVGPVFLREKRFHFRAGFGVVQLQGVVVAGGEEEFALVVEIQGCHGRLRFAQLEQFRRPQSPYNIRNLLSRRPCRWWGRYWRCSHSNSNIFKFCMLTPLHLLHPAKPSYGRYVGCLDTKKKDHVRLCRVLDAIKRAAGAAAAGSFLPFADVNPGEIARRSEALHEQRPTQTVHMTRRKPRRIVDSDALVFTFSPASELSDSRDTTG